MTLLTETTIRVIYSARFVQIIVPGSDVHGERGERAYNGDLGLCSQWGSGAKPLVRGALPTETDDISTFRIYI